VQDVADAEQALPIAEMIDKAIAESVVEEFNFPVVQSTVS
jgi:hypothetical protein